MKKCATFEEQKGTRYIRGNVYFGIIISSWFLSTKLCLNFLFICFAREIKGFYHSSFGNEVDLTNIMNISSNILAKNLNFKKLRQEFVDERAMIPITSKETHNLYKNWSLNLWSTSNKNIMEHGNVRKATTFKSFLNQCYKNTQLFFLWQCFLIIFIRQTQK